MVISNVNGGEKKAGDGGLVLGAQTGKAGQAGFPAWTAKSSLTNLNSISCHKTLIYNVYKHHFSKVLISYQATGTYNMLIKLMLTYVKG